LISKKSLNNLGIHFDQFTNEKTFYENGDIDRFLEELKAKDLIYEKEGATWFRATALGKDQDRVYIKSSSEPTYRVPDTAYHRNKIARGFDLIIDIFGSDHTDAYPDVLLALNALGENTDNIRVLIYQFVTLLRGGEKVKCPREKPTLSLWMIWWMKSVRMWSGTFLLCAV
jgi:arginyl-tRNA synthetase (EC 6.1.1.19)